MSAVCQPNIHLWQRNHGSPVNQKFVGTAWSDKGYGWLPYEYVLKSQADDWWTLLKHEYIDTKQFGL
jgi:hypothetical protein